MLSGGERTRLAVARMLLGPSNTLLLDEPTNHLDLDSKDILLEALEDYGGTLIFVSHDRYFVEKLATKIVEIGHGDAVVFPGTYAEFLWSKEHTERASVRGATGATRRQVRRVRRARKAAGEARQAPTREARAGSADSSEHCKEDAADHARAQAASSRSSASAIRTAKKAAGEDRRPRGADRRARAGDEGDRGRHVGPRFYDNRDQAQPLIDRHQTLMWELGDLMHQWEELQNESRKRSGE